MAVSITATAQAYTATTGLPAANVASMTCFAMLTATPTDYRNIGGVSNAGGAAFWTLSTRDTTASIGLFDNVTYLVTGAPLGATTIPLNAWWKYGVSISGANVAFYCAPVGSGLTVTTATNFTPPATPTEMAIGEFPDAGSGTFWNGRIAGMKWWQAQLTAGEIDAELSQIAPVRWTNLLRYHPFRVAETTDYSGNARTLSGGTGATSTVGPPVPMSAYTQRDRPVTRAYCRNG